MKNFAKKYLWLWEIIGAALVLALSIVIVTTNSVVNTTLPMIVGILFLFLGLFRIIPLVKTTEDKILKWCYGIETAIEIICGGILIAVSFMDDNGFKDFVLKNCGYFIGSVLYLRGFTFFFGTNVRHEEYSFAFFISHIIFITLGTAIIVKGGMAMKDLAWFIFALGIVVTAFLGFNGGVGYKNYRNMYAAERTTKKVKKEKKEKPKKEAPTSEEIKEEETLIIDPVDVDKEKDQPTL